MFDINTIMSQVKEEARAKGEDKGGMSAYAIISKLQEFDVSKPIIISMKRPIYNEKGEIQKEENILIVSDFSCDSWRGSYDLPAMEYDILNTNTSEIDSNITVETVISSLREVHGKEVTGYKGGDFVLSGNDIVFIANYSETNNSTSIVDIKDEGDVVVAYANYDMY